MKYEISGLYTSDFVYDLKTWKGKNTLLERTGVVLAKDPLMIKSKFPQDLYKLPNYKS